MSKKRKRKYSKRDLITTLRKLSDFWPDGYWLFIASGTPCLMKKDADGDYVYGQDYEIDTFPGIDADGGDW